MSEFIRKRTLEEQTAGLGLFDSPPTRANMGRVTPALRHNVATSQDEERRLRGVIRGQSRAIVDFLREHGPHTRVELGIELDIPIQSICPAVAALRKEGYIVQLEDRRGGGFLLRVVP